VGGAEYRPHVLSRQRQPGRKHQQRDVLGKCLGNARKRILDARPRLRGKYAVALAALDAGIAVRHADADAFLPAENRANVERGAGLDQRVAWIAGEKLCALASEDFRDNGRPVHGWFLPWLVVPQFEFFRRAMKLAIRPTGNNVHPRMALARSR